MKMAILIAGLAPIIVFAATTHAEDETEGADKTTTNAYRSPWTDESETDPLASLSSTRHLSPVTSHFSSSTDPLLPKRNPDDIIDQRPTRKVYDVDNRGDRELYPDLIIEPSIYDRHEVYETDRDGLAMDEPKAIIKHGLHDSYEVYKTDRYGMPEDIPSKVIKTDRLGRQEVYRTDRYGMAIGDPINERIVE